MLLSPYSWLEEYTAPEEWVGGSQKTGGDSSDVVATILSQVFIQPLFFNLNHPVATISANTYGF